MENKLVSDLKDLNLRLLRETVTACAKDIHNQSFELAFFKLNLTTHVKLKVIVMMGILSLSS